MILSPGVKINLGLNILRKRPDGYHDLETLFVPVSGGPHDTLEIVPGDGFGTTAEHLRVAYSPAAGAGAGAGLVCGGSGAFEGGFAPEMQVSGGSGAIEGGFAPEIQVSGSSGAFEGGFAPEMQVSGGSGAFEGGFAPETLGGGAPQRVQAISPDGKLMITIARREGVDWDPLRDLTARAYFLLAQDFKLPPMKIYLEKGSPVGAGLGGGSADAAFALRAIAKIAALVEDGIGPQLTDSDLASYAARLGSDCAFFIYNRPMFASGRGEVLEEFPPASLYGDTLTVGGESFRIELVIPSGISVSTADAYRNVHPHEPEIPLREVLRNPSLWREHLHNDFEDSVFPLFPKLAALKQSLYDRGAFYASMSGSGSALFGLFRK